jgi:hypothetical protein
MPPGVEFPDDFDPAAAGGGDRVQATDGTRWVVVESRLRDEKTLLRRDVVEYDRLDHPALTGAAGMGVILAAFLAPPVGAVGVLGAVNASFAGTLVGAIVAIFGGWLAANLLLERTLVGREVYRFLEWSDYRGPIMAMRNNGGEAA